MPSLTLPCWGTSLPVGPEVCRRPGFGRLQGGIKGQQECGPLLNETDPGVAVAVNTAFVSFGLSEPACEVAVVLWRVRFLTPNKETGRPGEKLAITRPIYCLVGSSLSWHCSCKT